MVGSIEAMGSNEVVNASCGFYFSSQVMTDSIKWIMMKINPNLIIKAVENLPTKQILWIFSSHDRLRLLNTSYFAVPNSPYIDIRSRGKQQENRVQMKASKWIDHGHVSYLNRRAQIGRGEKKNSRFKQRKDYQYLKKKIKMKKRFTRFE